MKRKDIIFLGAVILASGVLFCLRTAFKADGVTAVIYSEGEIVRRVSLNRDGVYDINGTNTVTVSEGAVYMSSADCPDKLCVKQGKIHSAGQSVVCLPNRIVISIE